MTSRIDQPSPIPPATSSPARRTEETDTRQAILRHDPEFYKKKKDEGEQPGFKDPYEDLADVSVPALKNFLLGLLDRIAPDAAAPYHAAPHEEAHRIAASPQAAAAVSAYQKRSGMTPAPPPPVPVPQTQAAADPGASALDQAAAGLDRAEVLDLIRELDRLSAEGVTAIALEKGDGFLASIRGGIARVRAGG